MILISHLKNNYRFQSNLHHNIVAYKKQQQKTLLYSDPYKFFRDINPTLSRVLGCLMTYNVEYGRNDPTQKAIAVYSGISVSHTKRLLYQLKDLELIKVVGRYYRSSIYKINPFMFEYQTVSQLRNFFRVYSHSNFHELYSVNTFLSESELLKNNKETKVIVSPILRCYLPVVRKSYPISYPDPFLEISSRYARVSAREEALRGTPYAKTGNGTEININIHKRETGSKKSESRSKMFNESEKRTTIERIERKEIDSPNIPPLLEKCTQRLNLSKLGQIKMMAFPDEALEYALKKIATASLRSEPAHFFLKVANNYCIEKQLHVDWSFYFRLGELLGLDPKGSVSYKSDKGNESDAPFFSESSVKKSQSVPNINQVKRIVYNQDGTPRKTREEEDPIERATKIDALLASGFHPRFAKSDEWQRYTNHIRNNGLAEEHHKDITHKNDGTDLSFMGSLIKRIDNL